MRNKKFISLVIVLLVLFSLSSFAETKKLKSIGQYTLVRVKGNIPTQEVMKTLVEKYAGDIKYGFDLAGYGDLYLPFMDQLKAAKFEERTLAVGDKVMWMLFRSHGKVKIVFDVEWAGKQPLEVFSFKVEKDFKHYEFLMPKPCGNISLFKVEEIIPVPTCNLTCTPQKCNVNDPITIDMSGSQYAKSMEVNVYDVTGTKISSKVLTPDSPKWQTSFNKPGEYTFKARVANLKGELTSTGCEAKTYINFPPVCKLTTSCLPCQNYVGRPIAFDASGSSDPDGDVVKAAFEITDPTGKVVDTFLKLEKPFTWEKVFKKPGTYTVSVVVTDNMGAVSVDPCKVTFEVTQKKLFLLIEAGPLIAKGTYTAFLFSRGGFLYKIVPNTLDFTLSAGVSVRTKGDPWRTFFIANALFNLHAGPTFFGAGLGYTSKEQITRKGGVDAVGNVGVDLFNKYTSIGSLFLEFRSPIGSGRPFEDHHKFALGFRILF
jgi:hypothetical protein